MTYNQRFSCKAYNMLLCSEKCSTSEICCKCLIEWHFEKFTMKIQVNTLQPKSTAIMVNCIPNNFSKFTNSIKNTVLYLFNRIKGKCMSIVYQFDCYCITNRFLLDTFCNIKRIHFTECKYGNLQSDFPVISKNKI
jgi:hypothetical protein